jgi:hypothetical protein
MEKGDENADADAIRKEPAEMGAQNHKRERESEREGVGGREAESVASKVKVKTEWDSYQIRSVNDQPGLLNILTLMR